MHYLYAPRIMHYSKVPRSDSALFIGTEERQHIRFDDIRSVLVKPEQAGARMVFPLTSRSMPSANAEGVRRPEGA